MNRFIGERDWSAQEVSHILFGVPLYSGTRQVVILDCRPENEIGQVIDLTEDGERPPGKSLLQKYRERAEQYNDITLFQFLSTFQFELRRVSRPRPNAKARVILYQPQYKSQASHPEYKGYCRTKIALHHPWREYPTLPWEGNATWQAAYFHCCNLCEPHDDDYMQALDKQDDDDEFAVGDPELPSTPDALAQLAGETAGRNPAARREDPDNLGDRTDDWRYDWSFHIGIHRNRFLDDYTNIYSGVHWWARAKELHPAHPHVRWHSLEVVQQLAPEQRLIYDQVMSHFRRGSPGSLLINVDGEAGTGKSFIIQVLSAHLQAAAGNQEVILRCAPTGAASFGISGSTLHALLKLPIKKSLEPLSPPQAQEMQAKLAGVKYLVIDEKSMVSLKTLHYVDSRLQQAFAIPERFGGISIILFGDFWQLPPVLDKPLYFNLFMAPAPALISSQSARALIETETGQEQRFFLAANTIPDGMTLPDMQGYQLYRSFTQSVELTVQQRQDPAQAAFIAALQGLRYSKVTRAHWETLSSRCQVGDFFSQALPHFEKKPSSLCSLLTRISSSTYPNARYPALMMLSAFTLRTSWRIASTTGASGTVASPSLRRLLPTAITTLQRRPLFRRLGCSNNTSNSVSDAS